jgi:hypothetical protein
MRGRHSAWTITLDSPTLTTLQPWLQRRKTPVGLARRAMLLLDQGYSCVQIDTWAGLANDHVRKWADRFQKVEWQACMRNPALAILRCLRQRWLSILSNWRVKDPTIWAVPSPNGIAPSWLVGSKPMESSRPFQPIPSSHQHVGIYTLEGVG